jgi:hypothetical protein
VEELRKAAENDRVFASFARAEAGPTTSMQGAELMQDTVVQLELQVRLNPPTPVSHGEVVIECGRGSTEGAKRVREREKGRAGTCIT